MNIVVLIGPCRLQRAIAYQMGTDKCRPLHYAHGNTYANPLTQFTSSGVKTIEMQRPVGQNNAGVSLLRQSDGRLIVGVQLRTTTLQTDLDFSLMRLLGTP